MKKRSAASEYLSFKTDYVGDNSKVGGIISLFSYPSGVSYGSFELQTASTPYGVIVKLNTDSSGQERCMSAEGRALFMRNAAVLMSLVKNADNVEFQRYQHG